MFLNVDVRQFRAETTNIARNCLTSTFKNIVMQMRKGNCEKGYWEEMELETFEVVVYDQFLRRYAHQNEGSK